MARLGRTSQLLETTRQPLAGINSTMPPPIFGPTVVLSFCEASMLSLRRRFLAGLRRRSTSHRQTPPPTAGGTDQRGTFIACSSSKIAAFRAVLLVFESKPKEK
jgi:hypothetical protein